MTTPPEDLESPTALGSLTEDLNRLFSLARSIETTEHVLQGSDEWARRENRKVLFDEGVDLMNEHFAIMRVW